VPVIIIMRASLVELLQLTMTPKAVRWIGWQPPEEGWVNTNGDSKDEGIAGCGGLIRDH
ncbi:hypothetical protein A2U01_0057348, partial [Trifolium medium]|nr:hypothetical protein [Trifolium medium]